MSASDEYDYLRRITVEEAEHKHLVSDDTLGPKPVPFGFCNKQWEALKQKMQEGDELWEFSTSKESWEQLMGSAGIYLMRNGEVIDGIETEMN